MKTRLLLWAILALALAGCHKERQAPVLPPWATGLRDVRIVRDLGYADDFFDSAHRLDLVIPHKHAPALPLVVYIHGGAWMGGDKWDCPGRALVKAGYAVASVNYRLTDQATFPAQIEDCKAALRYLRAHAGEFGLDPDRIGVWGSSAGGHLVAMLGTTCGVKEFEGREGNASFSCCVQAVCDWYGPSDLVSIVAQQGPKPALVFGKPDSPEMLLVGPGPGDQKQRLARASPVTYVKRGQPPFLIMHGDQDNVVPLAQSEEFYRSLKKAGVEAQLLVVRGAGHGFMDRASYQAVIDFFDRTLKR